MKTKYVCRGLIGLYVNFHNNRTMWSTNLHVKICRWGGGGEGKRARNFKVQFYLTGTGGHNGKDPRNLFHAFYAISHDQGRV